MARRSSDEAENHWPGFVDALSTIVMVVTFLLIILSIAIFAISQQVAKSYIESVAERTQQGGGDKWSSESKLASGENQAKIETPKQKSDLQKKAQNEGAQRKDKDTQNVKQKSEDAQDSAQSSASQTSKAPEARFQQKLAERLTQDIEVKSETRFTLRSRDVDVDERRIVVASDERADEQEQKIEVKTALSILTLEFDDTTTRLAPETIDEVNTFLDEQKDNIDDGKIAIWSFASSTVGSVSEAKRIAYYRALSARNEIVKTGFPPEKITVQVRIAKTDDQKNLLKIIVQP